MREIPSLQTLCLRSVGGKACNAEDSFAQINGKISLASQLLRSGKISQRTPSIGSGSARRKQANDVDLHHPWVAVRYATDKENKNASATLYAEYNTAALDVLQSYIDSLVELSRMDDGRLGLHFFQEWKALVEAKAGDNDSKNEESARPAKKARKSTTTGTPPPLGSLSLYNTIIQQETIGAMVESKMTEHLAVLDWTGVQTLTDDWFVQVIKASPNLQRLSVKNCRRLTKASLACLAESRCATSLTSLDLGGAYNLPASDVVEMIAALPNLAELHASGLLWTDTLLADLSGMRSWRALSLGFLLPVHVSPSGLKQALILQSGCLTSLALPFCEHLVDAPLLGVLGRHLPHVVTLDVRGNSNLNSLTGWYDGRATIQPMVGPQPLFVLARYSNISKGSIEDTKRIHPLQALELEVCMGSEGVGVGIRRMAQDDDL